MNVLKAFIPLIIGVAGARVIAFGVIGLDPVTKLVVFFCLVYLMMAAYSRYHRMLDFDKQREEQAKLRAALQKTRHGLVTLDTFLAGRLYDGASKAELKKELRSFKYKPRLAHQLVDEAYRFAFPDFLQARKTSLDYNTLLAHVFLAIAAGIASIGFCIASLKLLFTTIPVYYFADFLFRRAWKSKGCPNPKSPLYYTWKHRHLAKGWRALLLLWLKNMVALGNALPPTQGNSLSIFEDSDYRQRYSTDRPLKAFTHCVISGPSVSIYSYTTDPREPMSLKKYSSVTEYLVGHYGEYRAGMDAAVLAKYPPVMRSQVASRDPSVEQDVRTERMVKSADEFVSLRKAQLEYWKQTVAQRLRSDFVAKVVIYCFG
ncbi:MAG: hypothetical protein CMK89_18930 [Pseudomonadales bacterium]|nr:hypothetical protein [Pseudomonadales bacterium]